MKNELSQYLIKNIPDDVNHHEHPGMRVIIFSLVPHWDQTGDTENIIANQICISGDNLYECETSVLKNYIISNT